MNILSDPVTIGLVFIGFMGYKIVGAAIDVFIKKVSSSNYITIEKYEAYEKAISNSISELRAMMIIIAIKTGIKEEDLTELIKGK